MEARAHPGPGSGGATVDFGKGVPFMRPGEALDQTWFCGGRIGASLVKPLADPSRVPCGLLERGTNRLDIVGVMVASLRAYHARRGWPPVSSDSPRRHRHGAGSSRRLANDTSPLRGLPSFARRFAWRGRGASLHSPLSPTTDARQRRSDPASARDRPLLSSLRALLPWPAVTSQRRRLRACVSVVQSPFLLPFGQRQYFRQTRREYSGGRSSPQIGPQCSFQRPVFVPFPRVSKRRVVSSARNDKAIQGGDPDETGQGQNQETLAAKEQDGQGRSGVLPESGVWMKDILIVACPSR